MMRLHHVLLLVGGAHAQRAPWTNYTSFGATCEVASLSPLPAPLNLRNKGTQIDTLSRQMTSFPPLEKPDAGAKLKVRVNVGVVRIEQISPESSNWKLRVQTDMYWDQAFCDAGVSNRAACDAGRFGTAGLYFVGIDDILNPDGATLNSQVEQSGLFSEKYENGACLAADYSDLSLILSKNFVPTWYPYESYLLQIALTAVFSNETVELLPLDPNPDDSVFNETMPPGWTSENGVVCAASTKPSSFKARGAESRSGSRLQMSQLVCSIVVSFTADSWFLTAFIFWLVTMAANLLMGVGTFGAAKTPRELEEVLVSRGAFSSSLVLAYVFVVPANPHNLPIGRDAVPTSSQIFVWGLSSLTFSAFYSFVLAKSLSVILRERDHHNTWYEPFLYPTELSSELAQLADATMDPLRSARRRLRRLSLWRRRAREHTDGASVSSATIEVASAEPTAHGGDHLHEGGAIEHKLPGGNAGASGTARTAEGAGVPSQPAARASMSDQDKAREFVQSIRTRSRVACFDMTLWVVLHLVTIIIAISLLVNARSNQLADIDTFKAAAAAGKDAAAGARLLRREV